MFLLRRLFSRKFLPVHYPGTMSLHKVPEEYSLAYKDLPNPKRVWVGKPGSREEGLGRLSLLTPEVVLAANKSEVQTGVRVGMNWDLTKLEYAGWGRKACQHEIVVIPGDKYVDDVYHFNPRAYIPESPVANSKDKARMYFFLELTNITIQSREVSGTDLDTTGNLSPKVNLTAGRTGHFLVEQVSTRFLTGIQHALAPSFGQPKASLVCGPAFAAVPAYSRVGERISKLII